MKNRWNVDIQKLCLCVWGVWLEQPEGRIKKNNTRNVSIFLVYVMASASPMQWEEKWPLRQLLPGSLQSGKPHPGKRPADEVTSPKPSAG